MKLRLAATAAIMAIMAVAWGWAPKPIAWADENLADQIAALQARVEALEDKIASVAIPPFTLESGPNGYVRSGTGNWSGKITVDTPGVRAIWVQFKDDECGKLNLAHQGTGPDQTVFTSCNANFTPATGGMLIDFQDVTPEAYGKEAFPLGEYAMEIESKGGEWEIRVLGHPTGAPLPAAAVADPAPETPAETVYPDGMYRVGTDIEPGLYQNEGQEFCYWERSSGFSGEVDDIIANGVENGVVIVDIQETDAAFKSRNCGQWTRID